MSSRLERQELPPLVDPKDFLGEDFEKIKVGLLSEAPSKELLKWTIELRDESAFVFQNPHWFVIKAHELGVPTYVAP